MLIYLDSLKSYKVYYKITCVFLCRLHATLTVSTSKNRDENQAPSRASASFAESNMTSSQHPAVIYSRLDLPVSTSTGLRQDSISQLASTSTNINRGNKRKTRESCSSDVQDDAPITMPGREPVYTFYISTEF